MSLSDILADLTCSESSYLAQMFQFPNDEYWYFTTCASQNIIVLIMVTVVPSLTIKVSATKRLNNSYIPRANFGLSTTNISPSSKLPKCQEPQCKVATHNARHFILCEEEAQSKQHATFPGLTSIVLQRKVTA